MIQTNIDSVASNSDSLLRKLYLFRGSRCFLSNISLFNRHKENYNFLYGSSHQEGCRNILNLRRKTRKFGCTKSLILRLMDLWREFVGSNWGREFVAGGVGGTAGVLAGYPLDTLRIRQQNSVGDSAFAILRHAVAKDGPCSLYRGMFAPLASVTFQNAIAFQTYAILSRAFDKNLAPGDPPSYRAVALGGIGTGATQSLLLSPVELLKIRLQLENKANPTHRGPIDMARSIMRSQGLRGIYRGLGITVLRDAPSHGVYFWTYEYVREQLHPGCRKAGDEALRTMVVAGGLAGVASWICCYPLDVVKTRIQAQSRSGYTGMVDCFAMSIRQEGYSVLWRGLGTAVARAFVVNGAVFTAYETALRCIYE